MTGDTMHYPRRSAEASTTWVLEGNTITDTTVNFDDVQGVAKKLTCLIKVSTELMEDSAPDLAQFVAEEAGWALAKEEDIAGFTGTGTSAHGGVAGAVGHLQNDGTAGRYIATGHTTIGAITNIDIGAIMGTPAAFAFDKNCAWYANAYTIGNCFAQLGGTAGGEFATDPATGQIMYMGFAVHRTQALKGSGATTGDMPILFGALDKAAILFERRGLDIRMSSQRFLDTDQVAFLITERVDLNVHGCSGTSAGPLVGLQLG
jgi:HK97 family phage major capsid protein